ncbi:uncharacterized protein LOC134435765 [Engraulis encrasicolus]|uniref:uncharacterized protein LOC134435765 n=1 Tax=Engraulis encrasicolus TaxID=184585 RepID=UPI002FD72D70
MQHVLLLLLMCVCRDDPVVLADTVQLIHWTPDPKLSASLWPQPKDSVLTPPSWDARLDEATKPYGCRRQDSMITLDGCAPLKPVQLHKPQDTEVGWDSVDNIQTHSPQYSRSAEYDHHHIVALQPDQVVMEAADFLYKKHPTKSTLLHYKRGTLQAIRGPHVRLTGNSHVVLVGHGAKDGDDGGGFQLGGHDPQEIGRLVGNMDVLQDGRRRVGMVTVVGCYLGKHLKFAKHLLQALRLYGVETELRLYTTAVSVTPSGEQLTGGGEGGEWRHRDSSKSVFAKLDLAGNLVTRWEEGGAKAKGQVVPDYRGGVLYQEWPTGPQMFVPAEFRKRYPYIDCLEGLTWSLFYEEHGRRRAPDFDPGNMEAVWLNETLIPDDSAAPMKHITTILDLVCEIRFNAMEDSNEDVHYVLNNYIYKFHSRTLHTALVGMFIGPKDDIKVEKFTDLFLVQKEEYTLQELRQGLEASEFVKFCRQTFQLRHCERNCDLWGRYFMTAVLSASVRNFRTFSLFLVTTIACEVSHSQGHGDASICSAFVGDDYPMAAQEPGPEDRRRGFYGGTVTEVTINRRAKLKWLDEVVAKENSLYKRSMALMVDIGRDHETELDIFAKVKVLNTYVFSSFLEFFRGTEEGRRLKRGCVGLPLHDKSENVE